MMADAPWRAWRTCKEELAVGEGGADDTAVVFLVDVGQGIVGGHELGEDKGGQIAVLEFLGLGNEFDGPFFFAGDGSVLCIDVLDPGIDEFTGFFHQAIGVGEQECPFVRGIVAFDVEGGVGPRRSRELLEQLSGLSKIRGVR